MQTWNPIREKEKPWSSIVGSMTSSSSLIGDYIGIESSLDLKENIPLIKEEEKSKSWRERRIERDEKWGKVKEFPPPIPLLARTENLPSHMPWVLKRYYTDDGRLILREERVKHHEYFHAYRCNGRLILRLVPLDFEVYPPSYSSIEQEQEDPEEEEEEEEEDPKEEEEIKVNGIDVIGNSKSSVIGGNVTTFNKCLNYNSIRPGASCIFEMPVPAMRPVHS